MEKSVKLKEKRKAWGRYDDDKGKGLHEATDNAKALAFDDVLCGEGNHSNRAGLFTGIEWIGMWWKEKKGGKDLMIAEKLTSN